MTVKELLAAAVITVFYINMNRLFSLKQRLFNSITVYDSLNAFNQIKIIINDHTSL